jgi:hypothetical protein
MLKNGIKISLDCPFKYQCYRPYTLYVLQVELGQPNIIFNVPHPSLLLHIYEKITRSVFIPLIQEIKRYIIYGHIKHLGATGHSTAAVNSSFKLHSTQTLLLTTIQYIGLVKYHKGIEALCSLQDINLAQPSTVIMIHGFHVFHSSQHDYIILSFCSPSC